MPDESESPTDDLERLQRYLQWRDRTNEAARRSVRRRRLRGVVVAAAVVLVGVATLSWLSFGVRDSRPLAREDTTAGNTVPTPPPVAAPPAVATAPQVIERAPVAPKPLPNANRRTARATAHMPARASAPDPIRAKPVEESRSPSAAPSDRAVTSAAVTTPNVHLPSTPTERVEPPNERRDSAPPVETATPNTGPSPTVAEATPAHNAPAVVNAPATPPVIESAPVTQTSPVAQPPLTVAPGTVMSIESKPPCDDVTAPESADGRSRRQRVSDCVGGWLKGQSQQLGDGVKREVDDFRSGLDQVGRGLQWLGSKLRRPE